MKFKYKLIFASLFLVTSCNFNIPKKERTWVGDSYESFAHVFCVSDTDDNSVINDSESADTLWLHPYDEYLEDIAIRYNVSLYCNHSNVYYIIVNNSQLDEYNNLTDEVNEYINSKLGYDNTDWSPLPLLEEMIIIIFKNI